MIMILGLNARSYDITVHVGQNVTKKMHSQAYRGFRKLAGIDLNVTQVSGVLPKVRGIGNRQPAARGFVWLLQSGSESDICVLI
jgi:hypothetical protein